MAQNRYKRPGRIVNWSEYNSSLEGRGSLPIMNLRIAARHWQSKKRTGERGRPKRYTASFLDGLLVLMVAMRLPLRELRGQARALLGDRVGIPSTATICRYRQTKGSMTKIWCQATLFRAALAKARMTGDRLTVLVDSTGVSIRGIGTWRADKPGSTEKGRRSYYKLHTLVGAASGQILAADLEQDPDVSDAAVLPRLLATLPVGTVHTLAADGAYDTKNVYQALEECQVEKSLVRPRENAKPWKSSVSGSALRNRLLTIYDRSVQIIPGSLSWKKRTGYSVRSLIETSYSRLAACGGNKPSARSSMGRAGEIATVLELLNRYAALGLPVRYQRMWSV